MPESPDEQQQGEAVVLSIPLISTEFRLVVLDPYTLGLLSDNPVVRVLSPMDRSQAVDLGSALLKAAEKMRRRPEPTQEPEQTESGLTVVRNDLTVPK